MTVNDVIGDSDEHRDLAPVYAAWGTVGWDGEEEVVELGDGSDGVNGRTLVRVTLFRGRGIGKRPVKGQAQGRPIRAQIGWPLSVVPPKGMQVAVLFPDGDTETPGAGIIVTGVKNTTTTQFKQDRGTLDLGSEIGLTIKAKWVTLKDYGEAENPARFSCWLTVGPSPAGGKPGVTANDPTGSGFSIAGGAVGFFATDDGSPSDAKAVLSLAGPGTSNPGFAIMYKGASIIKADKDGNVSVGCGKALALVGAQVLLGASASPMSPVLWGFVGVTGAPSTSVFVSM